MIVHLAVSCCVDRGLPMVVGLVYKHQHDVHPQQKNGKTTKWPTSKQRDRECVAWCVCQGLGVLLLQPLFVETRGSQCSSDQINMALGRLAVLFVVFVLVTLFVRTVCIETVILMRNM